jgi:hypothetical protein
MPAFACDYFDDEPSGRSVKQAKFESGAIHGITKSGFDLCGPFFHIAPSSELCPACLALCYKAP